MQSAVRHAVNALWGAAMLILVATTVLITADVAGRYLFDRPIPGVLELVSDFAMPLMVFLTAAHCYRNGGLINVDIVTRRLRGSALQAVNLTARVVSVAIVAVMAYSAGLRTFQTYHRGNAYVGVFEYKLWPTHGLIFLGIALLVLAMILDMFASRARNFESPRASAAETAIAP